MRAVFLDRDGVINVDRGYTHRVDEFEFVPGSAHGLSLLQRAGWRLVVVTNQSGIARGLYSDDDYERFTAHMRERLRAEGVQLDAVLHCPHLPDAAVTRYRRLCDCRKPAPGMLLKAARELSLDLSASLMIGDRVSDVQAGRAAGVAGCLLVRSGHPLQTADMQTADAVYDNLAACAQAIVSGGGAGPR